jgi:E3 ubiquitin-protein ligase SHPRH
LTVVVKNTRLTSLQEFSYTNSSLDSWSAFAGDGDGVPVLLKVSRPHPTEGEQITNDYVLLELETMQERETIFIDTCTDPDILGLGKHLEIASGLQCADRYHSAKLPTACYQSTLRCLGDLTSYRLETIILWKETLDIVDRHKLSGPALEAFLPTLFRPKSTAALCSRIGDGIGTPRERNGLLVISTTMSTCLQIHPRFQHQ